jgi:hypothetical protein
MKIRILRFFVSSFSSIEEYIEEYIYNLISKFILKQGEKVIEKLNGISVSRVYSFEIDEFFCIKSSLISVIIDQMFEFNLHLIKLK